MKQQFNIFLESSQQFLNEIASAIPQIIGALLILLIGWIIAKFIKKIAVRGLKLAKLNVLTEKSGIEKFLIEGGIKITAVEVIGSLIYWIIMLVVILATFNSLNLTTASLLFNEIMLFIPNIIVSIIIFLLGIYLANMVSQIVLASLKNMQDKTAEMISKITRYAIIALTIFIILSQLSIAKEIVTSAFILLFGAICLAFGLAFGLGGKDWAADVLKKLNNKD
jgi:hypothetical protein